MHTLGDIYLKLEQILNFIGDTVWGRLKTEYQLDPPIVRRILFTLSFLKGKKLRKTDFKMLVEGKHLYPGMTSLLNPNSCTLLLKTGLVRGTHIGNDKRVIYMELTEEGEKVVDALHKILDELQSKIDPKYMDAIRELYDVKKNAV